MTLSKSNITNITFLNSKSFDKNAGFCLFSKAELTIIYGYFYNLSAESTGTILYTTSS